MHSHVMFLSDGAPDSTNKSVDIERQTTVMMRTRSAVPVPISIPVPISVSCMAVRFVARFHFGGDDQALFIRDLDRERRATSRPHRGKTLLHSQFNFLRIKIAAADDNQILQPTSDE